MDKSDAEEAELSIEKDVSIQDLFQPSNEGNNTEKSVAEETDFFADGKVLMHDLGPEANAALIAFFDEDVIFVACLFCALFSKCHNFYFRLQTRKMWLK